MLALMASLGIKMLMLLVVQEMRAGKQDHVEKQMILAVEAGLRRLVRRETLKVRDIVDLTLEMEEATAYRLRALPLQS